MFNSLFGHKPKFYTWSNLDGSPGGDVSRFANVDPNAKVEQFGIVLSGTTLGPDAHVRAGDMVDGKRIIRFGPVMPISRDDATVREPAPV